MPPLSDTDVVIALDSQDRDFFEFHTILFPEITFGNGIKTYPANGVPLPGIGHFGLNKQLKRLFIMDAPGDGYVRKYDPDHHTIRIYQSGPVAVAGSLSSVSGGTPAGTISGESAGTPAGANAAEAAHTHTENTAESYTQNATTGAGASHNHAFSGEALAAHDHDFSGNALAGHTHDLTGTTVAAVPLAEVSTAHTPAETTLKLMVIGQ